MISQFSLTLVPLQHTPATGANRVRILSGLATNLLFRYECEGSMDDLQEALSISRRTIDVIPKYHNSYAYCLSQYEEIRELNVSKKLQHQDCDGGYIEI